MREIKDRFDAIDAAAEAIDTAVDILDACNIVLVGNKDAEGGLERFTTKQRYAYERGYGIVIGSIDGAVGILRRLLGLMRDQAEQLKKEKPDREAN